MKQTLKIKGIEGRSLPLAHIPTTPMPLLKPGEECEVPATAYYFRAWKNGDCVCEKLDADHKPPAVKASKKNTSEQDGK